MFSLEKLTFFGKTSTSNSFMTKTLKTNILTTASVIRTQNIRKRHFNDL